MSAIVPFRFHEDTLQTVSNGDLHGVTLGSLCKPFGLDPEAQRKKLTRAEWATTFKLEAIAEDGKNREVVCLDVRSINGWLFTLQTKTLRADVRPKLIRYQRECADILADHFLGRRGAPPLTAHEAAETFAQQSMRVCNDPLVMARMRRAIRLAALSTKRSWQSIEGVVRRTTNAPGWTQVALFNVPRVMTLLEAIADGVLLLPRPRTNLRLLPNPRQTELSFRN